MLSKEECKRALENMRVPIDIETEWYSVDILNEVIDEHFGGIDNLNKVIEVQKNNLTDSYTIGLYNGLVTAKAIMLNNNDNIKLADNTIHPYKFEDLKVGMWVWHKTNQNCVKIGKSDLTTFKDDIKKLCDNKEIYPVQMANEDKL